MKVDERIIYPIVRSAMGRGMRVPHIMRSPSPPLMRGLVAFEGSSLRLNDDNDALIIAGVRAEISPRDDEATAVVLCVI